ncbi:MAG: CBS domain-containing protein [Dehalococcoidia bacterium]|nr:CBS domain-containing protein [Dehalococcoidia bacterium]
MNAIDIMNRPVLAADKSTSARDLAIQMLMGGFSGIPITERDGALVGIVSELDIIRALRAGKPLDTVTAAEIMTAEVITVNADATVEEIMEIMDTKQIVRVPVLEDGKLAGVVSRPDVLRAAIEPKFMRFS